MTWVRISKNAIFPPISKLKLTNFAWSYWNLSRIPSDELTEKYLEGQEISEAEVKAAIRKGTIRRTMVPMFCGSAFKNKGVQALLDAVIDYLPCPTEVPAIKGKDVDDETIEVERHANDDEPFAALAFKIMADKYGRLTFIRVYSGVVKTGTYVLNPTKGKKERISRLIILKADDRQEVDELRAGDLGAVLGLKDTFTGDTLCDEDNPVILESLFIPEPVISLAVEPKTKQDMEKLSKALISLSQEDPTFRVHTDAETNQTVIAGMGELHLEILVDRMLREFGVEANIGAPQVAYRETIRKSVKQEGKYIKQSGGSGNYGHVVIEISPSEPGSGLEFVSKIVGGSVPKQYINPIEQGDQRNLWVGILAGYPVIDLKVTLIDGSYHEVDSNEMAFKIAASIATKEAVMKAQPTLLEPVMKVEVEVPDNFLGNVIGDLNSRRGQIEGQEAAANISKVAAKVPLGEMFGYATTFAPTPKVVVSSQWNLAIMMKCPATLLKRSSTKNKGSPKLKSLRHHR